MQLLQLLPPECRLLHACSYFYPFLSPTVSHVIFCILCTCITGKQPVKFPTQHLCMQVCNRWWLHMSHAPNLVTEKSQYATHCVFYTETDAAWLEYCCQVHESSAKQQGSLDDKIPNQQNGHVAVYNAVYMHIPK